MSYYRGLDKPTFPKLDNKIKIDWDLYYELLRRQSPSQTKYQEIYVNFLIDYLEKKPGLIIERDSYGNIYVTKGKAELYPCVISHTDINQNYTPNLSIERNDKWIYGLDMDSGLQCGVGFDDKNGNLFSLMMLDLLDNIKIAFFKDEEIGAVGSKKADPTFFYNCSMIFQMDRNSYAGLELITETNGVICCSKEFVDAAQDILKKYSVIPSKGMFTDVGEIVKLSGVDCIGCNIGAGYFDEHSEQEITSIQALENSINFGYECLLTLGSTKWYHKDVSSYTLKDFKKNSKKSKESKRVEDPTDDFFAYDQVFVEKEQDYKDYKHILTDPSVNLSEDEIEESLYWGACPVCLSDRVFFEDDMWYRTGQPCECDDCGSMYYVSLDEIETM